MKKFLILAFLGIFANTDGHAFEYTGVKYSSSPTGQLWVSSASITIAPPSRLFGVVEFDFCNVSSSDTIFYRSGASTATTTSIGSSGQPIFAASCKFISLDPLNNQVTFYFSVPDGKNVIDLRWQQFGKPGGYQ